MSAHATCVHCARCGVVLVGKGVLVSEFHYTVDGRTTVYTTHRECADEYQRHLLLEHGLAVDRNVG